MVNQKLSGEAVAFRYMFPVLGYCSKGRVDAGEYGQFQEMLKTGQAPSRERLEALFPNAVESMGEYAKEHNLGDLWKPKNVRAYWLSKDGHNKIVKDSPLCAVYGCEVSKVLLSRDGEVCRALLRRLSRLEVESYIPLKVRDKVSMHGFKVAEKLSEAEFRKYFRK